MLTNQDIRSFHRSAVMASVAVVNNVTPNDLHRATPCDGWDLSHLLAHMTVQHRGFAAAAQGGGADPARWDIATVADAVAVDPAGTYAAAAADVLEAFADDGVLTGSFALPEFGPGAAFPGSQAIGFHFVDYVVHGWDVARSIDAPFTLPADVISGGPAAGLRRSRRRFPNRAGLAVCAGHRCRRGGQRPRSGATSPRPLAWLDSVALSARGYNRLARASHAGSSTRVPTGRPIASACASCTTPR
jgi:uncharacterized protein (TIGR03086 family)